MMDGYQDGTCDKGYEFGCEYQGNGANLGLKSIGSFSRKCSFIFFLIVAVFTVNLSWSDVALGSASGTIRINIETDEVGLITSMNGSSVLFSDTTSWWDIVQWMGEYAYLEVYLDGTRMAGLCSFIYTRAPRYIDDLRDQTEKSISWWPAELDPGEHTISYRMLDVYSGERRPSGGCRREVGNLITEYSVHVFVDSSGRQFLRPAEKLNLGYNFMQCGSMTGDPVNVGTGNSFQEETDILLNGINRNLAFSRSYNSRSESLGPLGFGWNHNFDVRLVEVDEFHVEVARGDGGVSLFMKNPDDMYQEISGKPTTVEALIVDEIREGWRWHRGDGRVYGFDDSGRLREISYLENKTALTYDVFDRLERVEDLVTGRFLQFVYNSQGLIISVTGPATPAVSAGVWVSYGYDELQNLNSIVYVDGSGFQYRYADENDLHNLVEKKDNMGHLLATWGYDDKDRVIENWSADGRGVCIDYSNFDTAVVTDAYGEERTYFFSNLRGYRLFSGIEGACTCRDCGGHVVRREYDGEMRLIEMEYAGGLIRGFDAFDSRGNAQIVRQAVGTPEETTLTRTFHPDINNLLTQIENSVLGVGSKVTIWDYDDDGNDIPNEHPSRHLYRKIDRGNTMDPDGNIIPYEYVTTYTYNDKGQVTGIDGPGSGTSDIVTFTYDPATGDLLTIGRPLIGQTVFSEYDPAGRFGIIQDSNQTVTHYAYDGRGRMVDKTVEADDVSYHHEYDYDLAGNIAVIEGPDQARLTYAYDEVYGRLIRVVDCLGNAIEYAYDSQGNRIEEVYSNSADQLSYWMRYDFQHPVQPGRLWRVISPDDSYSEFTYDSAGRVRSRKDPLERTTFYDYDDLGHLTAVTRPGETITRYAHDLHGNITSVTDAEGHVTNYTCDDLGRVVRTVSPDTGTTAHTYDPKGNMLSRTDAGNVTVTYAYDSLNRLSAIQYPDASQNVGFTYDQGENGRGRLTGMIDPSGTYTYLYDGFGRLTGEEKTFGGNVYTTRYGYDPAGRLASLTYPSGRVVAYERNGAGHIDRVTTTRGDATRTLAEDITHLPFGPVSGLSYGNGLSLNRSFDLMYRLTGSQIEDVQDLTYTLDRKGNIMGVTNHLDVSGNRTFTYDALDRLTGASGMYGDIAFTYDGVGNRVSSDRDDQSESYRYFQGTNRIREIVGPDPVTFGYDANGNITAMGESALDYNHNNRLIRASENGVVLGEYTYNGRGERARKVTDRGTVHYLYDKDGNLMAEADGQGNIVREYIHAEGRRLAMFTPESTREIEVSVKTDKGRVLSGVRVYAFTEAGAYTGQYAETDDQGVASFLAEEFQEGNFKFRADYLSLRFWSPVIGVPGVSRADVVIEEQRAEVMVSVADPAKEGIRVYLFNESEAYLGLNAVTDGEGRVCFDLPVGGIFKFRADHLLSRYWSDPAVVSSNEPTLVGIDTGGGVLTVTLATDTGSPLTGLGLYLFSPSGAYLGLKEVSDENGQAAYTVSNGDYKVRADYRGYQFWTDVVSVSGNRGVTLVIPHQEVTITVSGDQGGDFLPLEDIDVYLFTPAGAYMGISQRTDGLGRVVLNLPEREYKVRADYLGRQYWSETFIGEDRVVAIPEGLGEVSVSNRGLPLEAVRVYVFDAGGAYLGANGVTDGLGHVVFRLPEGDYNFRADYLGSRYWSGQVTLIPHVFNPVSVSTGGGIFTATVLKGESDPLEGVKAYLFSESGAYLGMHEVTSDQGEVDFSLADGTYKLRVDYLGSQFWTESFTIPDTLSLVYTIPHQDISVSVAGECGGEVLPFEDLPVYLFSASGAYLSVSGKTDALGRISFTLPEQKFKVRADYLGRQYWSEVFTWQDRELIVHEGVVEIHAVQNQNPLPGVNIYVFDENGSYLGMVSRTDENGMVSFLLPQGTYRFRADYHSSQYWVTEAIDADITNEIHLDTGGGAFCLTLEKAHEEPLVDTPVYVFTQSGAYIGINARTNDQGRVTFDLSEGCYTFRADYLGYRFWTEPLEVPQTLSHVLTVPHQDITLAVNKLLGTESTPLKNIKTYLFTESGAYQGINAVTNSGGLVSFSLPEKPYKVRADYLGAQYWSEVISWQDRAVNIDYGKIRLHVTCNGTDIENAPVYLFTEQGSYLGLNEKTDVDGEAVFSIPARTFKFRVDYNGTQHWTEELNILAHEETIKEVVLEQLALDLTNNPRPDRFDGKPPKFKPEPIRVASIGSLTGLLAQEEADQISGEKVYYFINDHLGTPQKLMDETGAVVWSADYHPFGAVNNINCSVDNNFRFPGQYYDEETGLHYNYHRYYDPRTGRYLTPDPIKLPENIACYTYGDNNPLSAVDPFGLKDIKIHEISPIDWGTIPITNAFRKNMRYRFMNEYREGMKYCYKRVNKDIKKCYKGDERTGCFSSYKRRAEYEECERQAMETFHKCLSDKSKWKRLHDKYSWWKAYKDNYHLNMNEAYEKYRRMLKDRYPIN